MHSYSINSGERKDVALYLAALSLLIAWLIAKLPVPWWIEAPSIMGVYGILYFCFDKFLWKIKLLHRLKIVKTPILSGIWNGQLNSHTTFEGGKNKEIKVTIQQTWTQIKLFLETETSKSYSFAASIVINEFEKPMLYYQYQNTPKEVAIDTMHIHCGSVHAKILDKKIEAEYYSGRDRMNTGYFEVTRT